MNSSLESYAKESKDVLLKQKKIILKLFKMIF